MRGPAQAKQKAIFPQVVSQLNRPPKQCEFSYHDRLNRDILHQAQPVVGPLWICRPGTAEYIPPIVLHHAVPTVYSMSSNNSNNITYPYYK